MPQNQPPQDHDQRGVKSWPSGPCAWGCGGAAGDWPLISFSNPHTPGPWTLPDRIRRAASRAFSLACVPINSFPSLPSWPRPRCFCSSHSGRTWLAGTLSHYLLVYAAVPPERPQRLIHSSRADQDRLESFFLRPDSVSFHSQDYRSLTRLLLHSVPPPGLAPLPAALSAIVEVYFPIRRSHRARRRFCTRQNRRLYSHADNTRRSAVCTAALALRFGSSHTDGVQPSPPPA